MKYFLIVILAVLMLKQSVNDAKLTSSRKSVGRILRDNQTNITNLTETVSLNNKQKQNEDSIKAINLNEKENKNENKINRKCLLKIGVCIIHRPEKN